MSSTNASPFAVPDEARPIVCTILARGGSKGVPGKNKREILGKPLLGHTVELAKQSGIFDTVAFSSDSQELLDIAARFGADCKILRPAELANDTAGKLPAIKHCAFEAERLTKRTFATIIDLDVTSPIRTEADILGSLELLYSTNASNVITGVPARRSPYFNLVEQGADGFVTVAKRPATPILRRQDAPTCFDMNASIYVWKRADLERCSGALMERTALFEMGEFSAYDIDSEIDFEVLEFLMQKLNSARNL
jgi:CMP-N,N'-diacetyllegionaminic acid synthase